MRVLFWGGVVFQTVVLIGTVNKYSGSLLPRSTVKLPFPAFLKLGMAFRSCSFEATALHNSRGQR